MAVQSDVMEAAGPYDRAKALSAFKLGDITFYWMTRACAISVLLILGGIILSLIVGAWPAMREYGFAFLWTQRWAPSADPPVLGALGPIYGTLITSAIAMMIAIPVGIGIAIFLTELCPQWLRRPIGIAIELLAGIPSIIFGMWGFFVLGPFLANTFQPFMIRLFDGWPVLGAIFAGPPSYLSLFNAALILAIMVLPFITAISVDVFKTVPPVLKEAAYGVGCTTWEVVRNVVIPYTRVGVIGGVMLALGRALGETMAVTFIIGNSFRISSSIFAPGTTISAAIASEFAESDGLHQSGLILLGLLLFVLTFFVLAAARLMLMRLEKKAGNSQYVFFFSGRSLLTHHLYFEVITLSWRSTVAGKQRRGGLLLHRRDSMAGRLHGVRRSRKTIDIKIPNDPRALAAYQKGEEIFMGGAGGNFSCASCHVQNPGNHIRTEVLAPALGIVAAMPIYRSEWNSMGTIDQQVATCNSRGARRPLKPQDELYRDVEYYLSYMSNGLPIFPGRARGHEETSHAHVFVVAVVCLLTGAAQAASTEADYKTALAPTALSRPAGCRHAEEPIDYDRTGLGRSQEGGRRRGFRYRRRPGQAGRGLAKASIAQAKEQQTAWKAGVLFVSRHSGAPRSGEPESISTVVQIMSRPNGTSYLVIIDSSRRTEPAVGRPLRARTHSCTPE